MACPCRASCSTGAACRKPDFHTAEARADGSRYCCTAGEAAGGVRAAWLEGLSTRETADALGLSLEVVKARLHRKRLWLRERLAGYFTELAMARTRREAER